MTTRARLLSAVLAMTVAFATPSGHTQVLSARKIFSETEASTYLAEQTGVRALNDEPPAVGVKGTLLLLPTIPVTFSSLEKDDSGEWRLGASITSGVGFTLMLGQAALQGETVQVSPWLFTGAALNAGFKEGSDNEVDTQLSGSIFFGTGEVAVTIARGFLDGETTFGLALKVDALTNLAPDAFMCFAGCRLSNNRVRRESR